MNRLVSTILTTLFLVAAAQPAAAGDPPGTDPLIPGRAIVRIPQGGSLSAFLNALNADFPGLGAFAIDSYPSRNLYLLQHSPLSHDETDDLEDAMEDVYPAQGLVMYAELLYEAKAPEGSSGSIWVDGVAEFSAFGNQYIRETIGLPEAHMRSMGASTVVAVLDTGIDSTHPALAGRIAAGGYNFVNKSANTADVGDGVDNDGDAAIDELVGHGTFIAGMIAMTAPAAKLLPVSVLNSDGKGDNWWIALGVFHAIDRGVEVINMSLTSTYDSVAVIDAILEAESRGIVVAAAAGNSNHDEPREYPAMDDDIPVLGVAATNDVDVKGAFSNYSDRLFISAPGANVLQGGVPDPERSVVSALPGTTYAYAQGTSMATPLVSGTAALIRAQHPEWLAGPSAVSAIRQALAATTVNINAQNPGFAGLLGAGRLNAAAAVALGPVAPDPGDINNDGAVNVVDLLKVINDWHMVHSSADINGSGHVDVADLLAVIVNWG